jgi:hypothetical protein
MAAKTLSSLGAPQPYKLSFQAVAEKATNLVRLAQSDPTTLCSLCDVLDQLTNRLRNSQSIVGQIVLGGQVFSTVFSIRRGIAPAGSFVRESFVAPGASG